MTATEGLLTVFIVAALGAALGARLSHAEAWKGAVALIVAAVVGFGAQVMFQVDKVALIVIVQIIVMGIVGSILKLSGRQNAQVVAGAILGGFLGSLIASAF